MEDDTPGPELVPRQRSFQKETLTLLHPDHVHRGVLPSAEHPMPSGALAPGRPAPLLPSLSFYSCPQGRVCLFREGAAKGRGCELLTEPWRPGARPLGPHPAPLALGTVHSPRCPPDHPSVRHMTAMGFSSSREAPNYRVAREGRPRRLSYGRLGEEGAQASDPGHLGGRAASQTQLFTPGAPRAELWEPRCEPCLETVRPQEQESDPATLSSPVPGLRPTGRACPVASVGSTAA